ncbi:MAG TPA: cytochrome b/b6 domain-containing protein [Anaeromyxobacteraceae bacterium]|nr:cytochrome b/b6 domain-containing protein [Anaeromyxobacteraceae bacterium]
MRAKLSLLALCLSLPLAAVAADAPAAAAPDPNQACLDCHAASKPGESGVLPAAFAKSVHGSFGCTDCHADYQAPGPHELPALQGADQALVERYTALKASSAPRAFLACGNCHAEVVGELAGSVHGKWTTGDAKVAGPTCASCHGAIHEVVKGAETAPAPGSRYAIGDRAISARCEKCHADVAFAEKAGLKGTVASTFRDSIHGRLVSVGSTRAPACVDCHGATEKDKQGVIRANAHAILAKTDPRSPVAGANRAQTCGRCHEGANDNFAKLIAHEDPAHSESKIPHFLHVMFSWLAALTLIFFAGHVLLDLVAEIRHKVNARKHGHRPDPVKETRFVQRFDIHQRAQHWLMLVGVILLGLTGWPLRGAGSPEAIESSRKILALFGGPHGAALLHRIAAVMIIVSGAYHILYLALHASRRTLAFSMLPGPRDVGEIRGNILYMLGMGQRPAYGKYSYLEKFDYWAVFWGMIMMVGTGFVLWFPVFFAKYAPHWVLTSAQIIHGEEATLALLFLFVVHFYNAHLKPSIFPMNWVWLTGKMSHAMLEEEHRGQYEELVGKDDDAGKKH